MALDSIQKKRKISKEFAQLLRKKKLIEGRYPNLFVSAFVAQATDKRAQYIKNRAFDAAHYEQLILKFIDQYGAATRSDLDSLLMDKLPEILSPVQKKQKIGNLVSKIRMDGLIKNQGTIKNPKWVRQKN